MQTLPITRANLTGCGPVTDVEPIHGHQLFLVARSDEEHTIAAALDTERQGSIRRLSALFGGFRFELLPTNLDANSAQLLTVDPAQLESLSLLDEIGQIMRFHSLEPPRMTFASSGKTGQVELPGTLTVPTIATAVHRARVGVISDLITKEQTAILNQIDQLTPSLSGLANDFERVFETRVGINWYASTAGAEGFGGHWDDHDVVILQLAGTKYWEILAPTTLSPLPGLIETGTVSDEVMWSGILEPGSALFIPRGWGHRTRATPELSTHLTIGMSRCTGRDILGIGASQLTGESDALCSADEAAIHVRAFAAAFDSTFQAHAIGYFRSQVPTRPNSSLEATIHLLKQEARGVVVALPFGATPPFVDKADEVAICAGEHVISIEAGHAALLARILGDDGVDADSLVDSCPNRDPSCVLRSLRRLARAGVLDVRWADRAPI